MLTLLSDVSSKNLIYRIPRIFKEQPNEIKYWTLVNIKECFDLYRLEEQERNTYMILEY